MALKFVTALPCRVCRPDSIWSANTLRDQPCSTALAANQRRSSGEDSLSRSRQWCFQGNYAPGWCTIAGDGGEVCARGACTIAGLADCATGGCTITVSGQSSAKARMYLRLRGEKPCWPGNSFCKSRERRSMTLVPQPSAFWRSRISRPMSQYNASSSRLAARMISPSA